MPPRKTPVISCDYTPLRFFVCNLCAPDRSTEQANSTHSEPLAGSSVGCIQVGGSGNVAHVNQSVARRPPTGVSEAHAVAQHKNHEPGSFTDCLQCETIAHKLALNPSSGRSGPFLASHFLERAAEHDGPICDYSNVPEWVPGVKLADGHLRVLTVLSNFNPLGKLFALAALPECQFGLIQNEARTARGCALLELSRETTDDRKVLAYVCYRSGDGFDIGVKPEREVARRPPPGEPAAIADHNSRALRLETGTALIVYGGAAVGVAGWVKGRPILLMAPEGDALITANELELEGFPLFKAIRERFAERVR